MYAIVGKRFIDVLASLAGLMLLWPVFIVAAVLILLDDGAPIFFKQTRVGCDEGRFTLWKLRSMRRNTKEVATHLNSAQSITPLGRHLRRTKLDELPQLWNVLKGEMSLVGPRPCLPSQVEVIEARRERGALSCTPGITGLAQVSGYDFSTPEETAACDGEYASGISLKLDLTLIAKTALGRAKDNADAQMSN